MKLPAMDVQLNGGAQFRRRQIHVGHVKMAVAVCYQAVFPLTAFLPSQVDV